MYIWDIYIYMIYIHIYIHPLVNWNHGIMARCGFTGGLGWYTISATASGQTHRVPRNPTSASCRWTISPNIRIPWNMFVYMSRMTRLYCMYLFYMYMLNECTMYIYVYVYIYMYIYMYMYTYIYMYIYYIYMYIYNVSLWYILYVYITCMYSMHILYVYMIRIHGYIPTTIPITTHRHSHIYIRGSMQSMGSCHRNHRQCLFSRWWSCWTWCSPSSWTSTPRLCAFDLSNNGVAWWFTPVATGKLGM